MKTRVLHVRGALCLALVVLSTLGNSDLCCAQAKGKKPSETSSISCTSVSGASNLFNIHMVGPVKPDGSARMSGYAWNQGTSSEAIKLSGSRLTKDKTLVVSISDKGQSKAAITYKYQGQSGGRFMTFTKVGKKNAKLPSEFVCVFKVPDGPSTATKGLLCKQIPGQLPQCVGR